MISNFFSFKTKMSDLEDFTAEVARKIAVTEIESELERTFPDVLLLIKKAAENGKFSTTFGRDEYLSPEFYSLLQRKLEGKGFEVTIDYSEIVVDWKRKSEKSTPKTPGTPRSPETSRSPKSPATPRSPTPEDKCSGGICSLPYLPTEDPRGGDN